MFLAAPYIIPRAPTLTGIIAGLNFLTSFITTLVFITSLADVVGKVCSSNDFVNIKT